MGSVVNAVDVADPGWIDRYQDTGCAWPFRVISAQRAADLAGRLADAERVHGGRLPAAYLQKSHLLFTWLADLVREPAILDRVEALLGPDLLVWSSTLFVKDPGDGRYVSWHQDSTYWGLSAPDVVTAWVALTPATSASGCMRVVPGTHRAEQLPHVDTFAEGNLLSRGQEIAVAVDAAAGVEMPLEPGEMSLHHIKLVHGSSPNRADHRRAGFAIRYIPTRIRQTTGMADHATLVRGVDRYGHFTLEPLPASDLAPEALAFHKAMRVERRRMLLRGTDPSKESPRYPRE
jgi:ectoine hydroxylase-related dioxygenase (phytanoyl-CoA dioxygenase family)